MMPRASRSSRPAAHLITRVPATDVAALKREPKLAVQTIETVYVFNVKMDMRDKAPGVSARDGSALDKNPFLDLRVREAIDLAIDRKALAEIAMEGLGSPAHQMVTPSIFGFNKTLGERKYDPAAGEEAADRGGLSQRVPHPVPLHAGSPARRHAGRHVDRAVAGRHRHRLPGRTPRRRRVLPGPDARRIFDVDVGLGHADG